MTEPADAPEAAAAVQPSDAVGPEQTPARPAGRLRGRAFWVIADQAVSSLANAGLSIVVARAVTTTEYGAFAVAFSIFSLAMSVSAALAGQVVTVRFSGASPGEHRRATAAATATALAVGGVVGFVVLGVVGVGVDQPLPTVLLALAILLPGLLLQDCWRTAFVSRGTPKQAFLNDGLWALVQVVLIGGLLVRGEDRAAAYLLAWGVAAAVAAAYGMRQARTVPALNAVRRFVVTHRDVNVPALANTLAVLGTTQVAFILLASIDSVETVGALRAAQTLIGPLNIIGFALTAFAIPEIVRRDLSRRAMVAAAAAISGVLVLAGAAWGTVLLLLPDSVGVQLLGATWTNARTALPGFIAFTLCVAATSGATAVMWALARGRYAMTVSLVLGPAVLVMSVGGAALHGVEGAAWGFAVAGAVSVVPAWLLLVRAVRLGRSGGTT